MYFYTPLTGQVLARAPLSLRGTSGSRDPTAGTSENFRYDSLIRLKAAYRKQSSFLWLLACLLLSSPRCTGASSTGKKTPGGAGTHTGTPTHRRTSQPSQPTNAPERPRDDRRYRYVCLPCQRDVGPNHTGYRRHTDHTNEPHNRVPVTFTPGRRSRERPGHI
jgi:hypothetical protein